MSMAQRCMDLIDENFFFLNGIHERWEAEKNILSRINLKTDEEEFKMIESCLLALHDPHTRLIYKENPRYVLPYSFFFVHKKLYLEWKGSFQEVESINQISVKKILENYINIYESFPLCLVEDALVKDIQFMKRSFVGKKIQISYFNDIRNKKILYPIKAEQWLKQLGYKLENFELSSVYVRRIDRESICIHIITFRDKKLFSKILAGLKQISGSYKTILFDVRNNTGGFIETTKELVSKLITKSIQLDYEIVKINKGIFSYEPVEITADIYDGFQNKRIIVFVNYRTMSSAEYIFTRALQIQGVSIVGEETAGLKDQASIFEINEMVALQITTKRYMQDGKFIYRGIIPDIYIESKYPYSSEEDPYFKWYEQYSSN